MSFKLHFIIEISDIKNMNGKSIINMSSFNSNLIFKCTVLRTNVKLHSKKSI